MTGRADAMEARLLECVRRSAERKLRPGERLTSATPLFSSGLVDSMGVVELVAFVEQAFGVILDLTRDELDALDTAAALANEIAQRRQASSRS